MGSDTHNISWDGVTIRVPGRWNLANYTFERGACRLEVEDDYTRRAVLEWSHPDRRLDAATLTKRGEKQAASWSRQASSHQPLALDTPGWHGQLLALPDRQHVAVIYGQPEGGSPLVVWAALFFGPDDPEQPAPFARGFVRQFQVQTGALRQWAVYDVSLQLPAPFTLASTSLQAGRKMLVFQHRLRRLCVWHFSLAAMLLKDRSPAAWCADFLNAAKLLRGPRFIADGDTIVTRRPWWRPFGHADEIGRWSFRYAFRITHDPERNCLLLWVFQYRRAADLNWWRDMQEV